MLLLNKFSRLYYVYVSSRIFQIISLVHSKYIYIKNLVYFWGTWSSVLYLSNTFALFLLCVFMLCILLFLFFTFICVFSS